MYGSQALKTILKGDFNGVRDGRLSMPFYYDLDLSIERSIADGTAEILNLSGNSFYIDQAPEVGEARVHFQDATLNRTSAPIYCQQGSIFYIPFTQLLFENRPQAGKILRIVYGVDLDFTAGAAQNVNVNGIVNVANSGMDFNDVISYTFSGPADVTLVEPHDNTNGIIIVKADLRVRNTTTVNQLCKAEFYSKKPTVFPKYYIISVWHANTSVPNAGFYSLEQPIFIPAGYGLYLTQDNANYLTGIEGLIKKL